MSSRNILITGAASGIGLAIAEAFARQGDRVVSLDRAESAACAVSVIGDVTNPDDHERAVKEATSNGLGLHVLIANAGIHDGGLDFDDAPADVVRVSRAVFDVDVVGYILALQGAAPHLAMTRGCAILTLSDSSFLAGQTGAGIAYTAAKYAGLGVVKWAARALAPDVRVNAVAPGGVITQLRAVDGSGFATRLFTDSESKEATIRSRNPLGTIMTPAQLADIYLFLTSDAAQGMTGEIIRPDGGLSVR